MTTDTRGPLIQRVGALRFQRYLGMLVAAFGLLYALQTLDAFVADWPTMADPLGGAAVALVAGCVLLGTIAGLVPSRARTLFLAAAILLGAAVAVWPFALTGPVPAAPMPWFVGLLPVSAAYLSVAFRRPAVPMWWSVALTAVITAVLLLSGVGLADALANALFGVAVSAVLVILIAAVRRGVERADRAQQAALAGYGRSRLDEATESERVRTDALVHDSVLTTFLAAAAASDPESEALARRMAANALRVLSHVSRVEDTGPVTPFGKVLGDAADRFAPLATGWDLQDPGSLGDLVLPASAGDAIVDAMIEAMTASVLHTPDATRRSVRMHELGPDGLRIVLADDGPAVDPADERDERAPMLRAAAERMHSVDGRVDLRTDRAGGSLVVLSWGSVVVTGTALRPDRIEVPT